MAIKKYHVSKNLCSGTANISKTVSGVVVTSDALGNFTVTGVADSGGGRTQKISDNISLSAGSYRVSLTRTITAQLCVNNASGNTFITGLYNEGTFTLNANTTVYFGLNFTQSNTYSDKFAIMLQPSSTDYPYEPYSSEVWHTIPYRKYETATDTITTLPKQIIGDGQSASAVIKGNMQQTGTPTPASPIYPTETGDKTSNLCEKVEAPLSQYRIYIEDFKSIIDDYSTFTLSFNTQLSYSGNTLYLYAGSNVTLGYITGTGTITKTFNLTTENKEAIRNATNPYIFVYVNNVDQSSNSNAMLVSGSTAPSSFIPYGFQIPISSGGTTTNVYLGDVQSTRRIKKLVLTGEESWQNNSNNACCLIYFSSTNYGIFTNTDPLIISNAFAAPHNGQSELYNRTVDYGISFGGSGADRLCIRNKDFELVSDFKAWLAQQYAAGTPVCVWYVLATETTTTLNEPLRKIGDYADSVSVTNIPTTGTAEQFDVDTTLKPSEVDLTYHGWHEHSDTKF